MTEDNKESQEEMSDEQAILKIAAAMKDTPSQEDKQNVHTFLMNVVGTEEIDSANKTGNLRDDKELNELGLPRWNVRGALEMSRIADKIMGNVFFKEYFEDQAKATLFTSLSREGFLIKMATTSTRQVADATKRRKVNKGMFGKKNIEETGGDINSRQGE